MIVAENSKNELKSDVNSRLKSDPIIDIDFNSCMVKSLQHSNAERMNTMRKKYVCSENYRKLCKKQFLLQFVISTVSG